MWKNTEREENKYTIMMCSQHHANALYTCPESKDNISFVFIIRVCTTQQSSLVLFAL